MKLVLYALIILPLACFGQTKFGLMGGYGPSNIETPNYQYGPEVLFESDESYYMGITLNIRTTEHSSFILEASKNTMKYEEFHYEGCVTGTYRKSSRDPRIYVVSEDCKTSITLNFLSIPVIYSFQYKGIMLNAGLNISFLMSHKDDIEVYDKEGNITTAYDYPFPHHSRSYSTLDFGTIFEIGYNLSDDLMISGRYYHSIGYGEFSHSNLSIRQLTLGIRILPFTLSE